MTIPHTKIKFIVSDLDGTLFHGSGKTAFDLSKRNEEALERCNKSDIEFCVSTGRMIDFGIELLKKYRFTNIRAAGFNGAVCSDCGKIVLTLPIPYDIIKTIVPIVKDKYSTELQALQFQTLTSERLFESHNDPCIESYRNLFRTLGIGKISDMTIGDYLNNPKNTMIGKVSFLMPSKQHTIKAMNELRTLINDDSLFITMSNDFLVEMVNPKAGKDSFISYLRNAYHFSKDEIAVIGDAPNDTKMFSESNLRFAMESGDETLKSEADFVVKDVAECIDYCINYNKK